MQISTYLMVLFGISVVFNLLGSIPNSPVQGSLMLASFTGSANISTSGFTVSSTQPVATNIINSIGALFTSPTFLATLGIVVVSSFLLGGGSFAVIYIIPLFILALFINLVAVPANFLFSLTGDPFIDLFFGILFNLWMVIGAVSFIRGGGI